MGDDADRPAQGRTSITLHRQTSHGRRSALATIAIALLLAGCGASEPSATSSTAADSAKAPSGAADVADATDATDDGKPGSDDLATAESTPDEPAADGADGSADDAPAAAVDGLLEVHYLDVGQGDATLLVHDDARILIDVGRWQASDVVPMLHARGVDALDLVVVTHPHADHIGQFDQVLDGIDVAEVWWSGSETTTQTFERSLDALERSGAAYEEPRAGDVTSIGPLVVEVVNPPLGTNLADLHDAGLSMRIGYGEVSLLFTGDAEQVTEGRMVAEMPATLDADVLQLGHHGSDTSTSEGLLSAVSPSVAIYSAGAGNSYGHPHASVIERLRAADVEVYGTDVHGTVTLSTDGVTWSITTERSGEVGSAADPARSEQPDGDPGDSASSPPGAGDGCAVGQIDINAATYDELQGIIHIGPARAEALIAARPFSSVRGLERISGIGGSSLADIIDQGAACAG